MNTLPAGYPFHNCPGYGVAAATAKAGGLPVYLNVSPVSVYRGDMRSDAPTGLVTDWCKVEPSGKAVRCI